MHNKTRDLTTSALFVALLAICSWISIPLPGTAVPINLATFAVILAGLILGRRNGVMAVIVFLLLGAVGVPVFHGFTGGLAVLAGPTGGFLIGYIALVFFAGLCADKHVHYVPAVIAGEVILYAAGSLFFMMLTKSSLSVTLLSCVVPFLPGDAVKIIIAYLVNSQIRRRIQV